MKTAVFGFTRGGVNMVVTIRDVALAAGVSPATVSRAMSAPDMVNEATRIRVRAMALKMGYSPNRNARNLSTGQTGSIGLVVPDLSNPFFGLICKGAQTRARAAGYAVFIVDTDEDPEIEHEVTQGLINRVEGLILCSARASDAEIERLADETPIVLANRRLGNIPSVVFDNRGGLTSIMEHLVALGHKRIAYAGGPVRSWSNAQFTAAFVDAGRSAPQVELVRLGNFPPYFSGGLQAADLAIASGATAVVSFNDIMALGIIDRFTQRGFATPDDFSVTGFDNISAAVSPKLTTVSCPGTRMGRLCVDSLLSLILGTEPRVSNENEIPVDLIVRRSTGIAKTSPELKLSFASLQPEAADLLNVGVHGS